MTKMKDKYSKGELAKEILKGLALGGFIATCFVLPNFAQVAKLFGAKDWKDKERLRQSLKYLNKQRFVKISFDKKGNQVVKITEKGNKKVLKYQVNDLKITIPKKWDKMWRLVIFDIPEKHKRARDAITLKLQDMGFYALQKSVFISPYECKNEVDFIFSVFKIRDYVHYFVVKKLEHEDLLRGEFGL